MASGGLSYLLKKIDESHSVVRKSGNGRPKTATTDVNIASVEELIQSQEEDVPGTHLTQRQISREIGIAQSSVSRISKQVLGLKAFVNPKLRN